MFLRTATGVVEYRMPAPPGSPWGDTTPVTNGMLSGGPVPGVQIDGRSSLGIGAVWACVGILSDAVSTLPVRQYKGRGADTREVDLSPVIADPWSEAGQTSLDFIAGGQVNLALRGNFYGRVTDRDRRLYPTQIKPLDIDHVKVGRNRKTGMAEYFDHGELIPPDDVFHIRNISRPGSLVGLNPIEELRLTLGLAKAAEMYGMAFFANSANPSGVIEVEGDLDDDETRALARAWLASHQGIGQAHLPAVLTGGAKWTQVQMNPEDAQFIESRQLSRSEIAMLWRIPPHMIGDVDRTTSWGTGIEQQELGFVRITLVGYIRRWEVALSNLLPPGQYVRFDLRKRLRGDTLQRFQAWTLARNGGWMNVDEIRAEEDWPALPDGIGEDYQKPLNMGSLGMPNPMAPDGAAQKSPSPGP